MLSEIPRGGYEDEVMNSILAFSLIESFCIAVHMCVGDRKEHKEYIHKASSSMLRRV